MWGISLAWLVTLSALAAIVYGTVKYLGLIEKRMRFTAAVTHELRTPLTSFQLYTDLLSEVGDDDPQLRAKYLATLRGESSRLSKLVENVLAYSKVGDSDARVNLSDISPSQIMEDVARESALRCEESKTKLVTENAVPADQRIETDPEFVRQVLSSLVDNACKYGGDTVWLGVRPAKGGGVVFEVDDAGAGIEQRDLREIFEPFRRGREAKRSGKSGMGLGLALSRYWASQVHGKLTVARSERNGGHLTRFLLELPDRPRHA